MNIIYHCFGGAHSSVMAAAIHLGHVTKPEKISVSEVVALPYFDIQDDEELGYLRLAGFDTAGNAVYVLGRDRYSSTIKRMFESLARHFGLDSSGFVTTDALAYVNVLMVIGGYLSRRIRMTRWGRLVVAYGTRIAAPYLAGAVAATRAAVSDVNKMRTFPGPVRYRRAIIYHSRGSALGALLAAAMHVGILEEQKCPSVHQVKKMLQITNGLPLQGEVVSFGTDASGDMILAVGFGLATRILSRALPAFLEISGVAPGSVELVSTPQIGGPMGAFGSLVDRLLESDNLGVAAMHRSLASQYEAFRNTVSRTRSAGGGLDPLGNREG